MATGKDVTGWNVQWKKTTPDGAFLISAGNSTFPFSFYYNWGEGAVYGNIHNNIGFEATATFKLESETFLDFNLGSDDGIQLTCDGRSITMDYTHHSYKIYSSNITLDAGTHTLVLNYYEWVGDATILFNATMLKTEHISLFNQFTGTGK
jgi:hypothetical protein